MQYTEQELKNILEKHRKWVMNEPDGERANLSSANLSSADLRSANLRFANLRFANLSSADLSSADLSDIKEDFFKRLKIAKGEVVGLYDYIIRGKINGQAYTGDCACFVGTIANLRHEGYENLSIPLKPESSSLTEKWFLAIYKGDTPQSNQVSLITSQWCEEFMRKEGIVIPEYKLISSLEMPELFGKPANEKVILTQDSVLYVGEVLSDL